MNHNESKYGQVLNTMLKNTNMPVKTNRYKSRNIYVGNTEMAAGPTVSGSSPPVLDEDHMDKLMKDSEDNVE